MATATNEPGNIFKKLRSSKAVHTIEHDVKPFQAFLTKFNNDWSMSLAGILAYNLLMAMLPIALALFALVGLVLRDPGIRNRIVLQTGAIFPGLTARQNAIALALENLKNETGILFVIGIILALFLGSRLFVAVEECFDIIYRVHPRKLIHQNLVAVSMLLLFIVLIPIMVFASIVPTFVLSLVNSTLSISHSNSGTIFLGGIVSGLLVSFLLFEAMYTIVPPRRIRFRNSWPGAVIAAVALEIYLTLFPFYTTHFLVGISGPVGFAIILLLFFYFFAVILLLGAEINAFFFEGVHPIPTYLPTLVALSPTAKKKGTSFMSTEQNKALVRRWWDDFNAHHLDFETFIHPEMLNHAVPAQRQRGFENFKATITHGLASVPDQHWIIDELIAEEDKVVCHMTWSGTQQGGYHVVVPRERHFSVHHVHTFRVTDGKFSEHWAARAVGSLSFPIPDDGSFSRGDLSLYFCARESELPGG